MTTSQRVEVKQSEINEAVSENVKGVTVKVMLSLFDVPREASADYDKDARVFRLRFDYIGGEEQTIERPSGEGISLVVGKHSERLYGIDIALAALLQASIVDLNSELVINVAEDRIANYRRNNPKLKSRSFEAVNRVLKHYSSQLRPALQEALAAAS